MFVGAAWELLETRAVDKCAATTFLLRGLLSFRSLGNWRTTVQSAPRTECLGLSRACLRPVFSFSPSQDSAGAGRFVAGRGNGAGASRWWDDTKCWRAWTESCNPIRCGVSRHLILNFLCRRTVLFVFRLIRTYTVQNYAFYTLILDVFGSTGD